MVAAAIRTVFAQPDAAAVADQLEGIAAKLGRQFPAVEVMLRDAAVDVCAFAAFPQAHWKQIWSTNPLERVNKEIKRRTNVVGIFPNEAGVLRLAGSVTRSTTSGKSPSAATCQRARWRRSTKPTTMTRPTRRWEPQAKNCSPVDEQPQRRRRSRERSHFPPLQGPRPLVGCGRATTCTSSWPNEPNRR